MARAKWALTGAAMLGLAVAVRIMWNQRRRKDEGDCS
jgi:hypothetical protein